MTVVRSPLVGARLLETVTVRDEASQVIVDPGTFLFTLVPPSTSGYATSTYSWNGTVWTSSEAVIAVPSRLALGTFTLRITIPYGNIAAGNWAVGWKSTANGGGFGEGSGEGTFVARPTGALPAAP